MRSICRAGIRSAMRRGRRRQRSYRADLAVKPKVCWRPSPLPRAQRKQTWLCAVAPCHIYSYRRGLISWGLIPRPLGRLVLGVRGICSPVYANISRRNLQYPVACRGGFLFTPPFRAFKKVLNP